MRSTAAQRSVILVDDDREAREMLARLLQSEGYHVLEAANGLKLISILHADRPRVIVLDVNLSWIDGFELCRSVKRNEEFRTIPVLFVSGRTSKDDVNEGLAAGAEAYFPKPVDLPALLSKLNDIVSRPPVEAE
jgi:DNA-binding response OmpR family regulator